MRYSQFERLVLGLGGIAIAASTVLSMGHGFDPYELGAQFLLFFVLIGAVHWGRRGGSLAALIATFTYIALRIPLILQTGMTPDILWMLLARIIAYALVGVVGGEVCGRIMYVLARLNDESAIDEESGVYTQRIAAHQLETAVGRCQRYNEPFCVVTVTFSPELAPTPQDSRRRRFVRDAADRMRGGVRMVDEVAHLDDGRFLVLLPHAPKDGGEIVAARLGENLRPFAAASDATVATACLSGVDDASAVDALLAEIAPADAVVRPVDAE